VTSNSASVPEAGESVGIEEKMKPTQKRKNATKTIVEDAAVDSVPRGFRKAPKRSAPAEAGAL